MCQVRLDLSLDIEILRFYAFFPIRSSLSLHKHSTDLILQHKTHNLTVTPLTNSYPSPSPPSLTTLSSYENVNPENEHSAETGLFGRRVIRLRLLDESRGHKFRCGGVVRITFPKSNNLEEKVEIEGGATHGES